MYRLLILLLCGCLGGCETLRDDLEHHDMALHHGPVKIKTIHGKGIYVGVTKQW